MLEPDWAVYGLLCSVLALALSLTALALILL